MRKNNQNGIKRNYPLPTTPEARENLMISRAMDLAEQQLMDGTASSQVITHFLKLASMRERQEREKMAAEIELLRAKQKAIDDAADSKAIYEAAIRAMRVYQGADEEDADADYREY